MSALFELRCPKNEDPATRVVQAAFDVGVRAGLTTEEHQELTELRMENEDRKRSDGVTSN